MQRSASYFTTAHTWVKTSPQYSFLFIFLVNFELLYHNFLVISIHLFELRMSSYMVDQDIPANNIFGFLISRIS